MPYRSSTEDVAFRHEGDRDLAAVGVVVWAASVVEVAMTLARHEPFGTIATLAVIAIVLLPCMSLRFRT